jgi:hypothetical protein
LVRDVEIIGIDQAWNVESAGFETLAALGSPRSLTSHREWRLASRLILGGIGCNSNQPLRGALEYAGSTGDEFVPFRGLTLDPVVEMR